MFGRTKPARKGQKVGAYKIGDVVGYEYTPFGAREARAFVGVIVRGYRQVGGAGVYQIQRLNTTAVDIEVEESQVKGTI